MDEKKAFGETNAETLNIGDIVEWSTWDQFSECWIYNYGIITEIKNEIRSNRMVYISRVLPLSGDKKESEHFTLSLRLVSKTGEFNNVNS